MYRMLAPSPRCVSTPITLSLAAQPRPMHKRRGLSRFDLSRLQESLKKSEWVDPQPFCTPRSS